MYVTKVCILFFIASLLYFKLDTNVWTNREVICESQSAEVDQTLYYYLRVVLLEPNCTNCLVPKANTTFAPFFSDSQVNTANTNAQVDVL